MIKRSSVCKDGRLHAWCKEGNISLLTTNVLIFPWIFCYNWPIVAESSATHYYMSNGHAKVLQCYLLLHHGDDINCRANNSCAPLHLAAPHGYVDCV